VSGLQLAQHQAPPTAPAAVNVTAAGETVVLAAPGAGRALVLRAMVITNYAAAKIRVLLREGAAGPIRVRLACAADGGGARLRFGRGWTLPANTALIADLPGVGDVEVTVDDYSVQ
jgi:hypothetical protein